MMGNLGMIYRGIEDIPVSLSNAASQMIMSPDLRIAVVVNPDLPTGLMANTVGAIAIGLGARIPAFGGRQLTDAAGRAIDISSDRPVPILQADAATLAALLDKALARRGEDGAVVPFPAFARPLHDYADYEATLPRRDLASETLDGLGLAGPAKWVKSLTGALKLLR